MRVRGLVRYSRESARIRGVLAEIRAVGVDRVVIGGDVLPDPCRANAWTWCSISECQPIFVIGNGDRETIAARNGSSLVPASFREAIEWNAAQLTDVDDETISSWALTNLRIDGVGEVACHAAQ